MVTVILFTCKVLRSRIFTVLIWIGMPIWVFWGPDIYEASRIFWNQNHYHSAVQNNIVKKLDILLSCHVSRSPIFYTKYVYLHLSNQFKLHCIHTLRDYPVEPILITKWSNQYFNNEKAYLIPESVLHTELIRPLLKTD